MLMNASSPRHYNLYQYAYCEVNLNRTLIDFILS